MIRKISASDRKSMPWKNGLGITEEIVIFPDDSSVEDFNWRVSMAYVTADSIFSVFPGITRHMVILEGHMNLALPDRTVHLSPEQNPLHFSGDTTVTASVVTGPVRDLNIMTKDKYYTAAVSRVRINAKNCFSGAEHILLATQTLTVQADSQTYNLERYDALYVDSRTSNKDLICNGECWISTITQI